MYRQNGGKITLKVMGMLVVVLLALGLVYFFLQQREKFSQEKSVVFYYMNGCGWCDKFKPEWEQFKKMDPSIKTKEVEASQMTEEEQKKIRGFPTIFISNGEKSVEYEGDRTAKDLYAAVKSLN